MKKIVGDLLKNRNIEESLKKYTGGFMNINNKYALIRLAMNYYTYYVSVSEDGGMVAPGFNEYVKTINETIEKYANGGDDFSENIAELEAIRNIIIEKVADITCYVDKYNVYEHAVNRVEYRFREEDYPSGYSDENFTRTIMQFILEDEDNMMINSKIKDVIGQLPVRLTKNKFFEMLSNGLSIYNGGTKEALDDFLYMIKTCSMLYKTDTMATNYPHLYEEFDNLKNVKFKEMDSKGYDEFKDRLSDITMYIDDEMDNLMRVQEVLNDLLLILYTNNEKEEDNVVKGCDEIIKNTNLLFLNKFSSKSLEEREDMFVMLEGEQEKIYPHLSAYDITDQIKESYADKIKQLDLVEEYNIVFKLPKLNSDSMFVKLDKVENNDVVDEAYLEKQKEQLINEYRELFKETDKMITRAVMAQALSELPIFFNNISELQDYIYNTLSICNDKAEKLACIEIINGIMAG